MSFKSRSRWLMCLALVCGVACSEDKGSGAVPSAAAGSGTKAGAGSGAGAAGSQVGAGAGGTQAGAAGRAGAGQTGTAGAGAPQAGSAGGAGGAGTVAGAGSEAPQPAPQAGSGGAPAATGCKADPLEALRGFAPSDGDASEDYMGYLSDELGTLTCATQGSGSARTISQTIFVPPNTVYDGKGERLTADAAAMRCDTSEGEQAENQRPYFVLAPGASLKNVTITYPGCEGVHMLGDNTLDNITWEDAGEDAASVRSYFPGGKITIANSQGHKAADKMFQFNAPCAVRIENFQGSDMGKLVRQNGGTEFKLEVDLNKVDVSGVISAVVQSDSPQCFVRYHDLKYQFTGSGDKSDRVFRDIPPANVTMY